MTGDEVFGAIRSKLDAARQVLWLAVEQAYRDYLDLTLEQQRIEDERMFRIWGKLLTDPPAPWTGFNRPDPPLVGLCEIFASGPRGAIPRSSRDELDPVLLSHAEARWERVRRRWNWKHAFD